MGQGRARAFDAAQETTKTAASVGSPTAWRARVGLEDVGGARGIFGGGRCQAAPAKAESRRQSEERAARWVRREGGSGASERGSAFETRSHAPSPPAHCSRRRWSTCSRSARPKRLPAKSRARGRWLARNRIFDKAGASANQHEFGPNSAAHLTNHMAEAGSSALTRWRTRSRPDLQVRKANSTP